MADWFRREVVTRWTEIALPNPTNWGQLQTAMAVVEQELGKDGRWDDSAEVVATEEEIIFRFSSRQECLSDSREGTSG